MSYTRPAGYQLIINMTTGVNSDEILMEAIAKMLPWTVFALTVTWVGAGKTQSSA